MEHLSAVGLAPAPGFDLEAVLEDYLALRPGKEPIASILRKLPEEHSKPLVQLWLRIYETRGNQYPPEPIDLPPEPTPENPLRFEATGRPPREKRSDCMNCSGSGWMHFRGYPRLRSGNQATDLAEWCESCPVCEPDRRSQLDRVETSSRRSDSRLRPSDEVAP